MYDPVRSLIIVNSSSHCTQHNTQRSNDEERAKQHVYQTIRSYRVLKMSAISPTCTSDADCNSRGKCDGGKCNCDAAYIGALCEYDNLCNGANPCENDGDCVPIVDDGSYYCDCPLGYIEPNCKQQDPCVLEGNTACLNGASCSRVDDFEYECQCQMPFIGEFCETYNLCHIDDDECIEDLTLDGLEPPICFPCISDSNCTQITITEYLCSCDPGVNHTSCYLSSNYKPSDTFRGRIAANITTGNSPWMPIIPWIASATLCLYIVVAILVLIFFWKRYRRRPKLIVCCDLDQFDDLTYYLISVETGSPLTAGTSSRTYCYISGENGEAGPYPLNDQYLREFDVLQRCQEDNYLVSHTENLGNLNKIVIWYGGLEKHEAWFCHKVTVKNIKTKENWFFYTSAWIQSDYSSRTHEFVAATTQHIKEMNRAGLNCQHYCYQMVRHHIYLSPFVYTTLKNVTLVAAEVMTYMLILIGLFGFLEVSDADFHSNTPYEVTILVLNIGSQAAGYGLLFGIIYSMLFIILGRKRVPTLLVWHNRPGMPEEIRDEATVEKLPPPERPPLPRIQALEPEPTEVLRLDTGTNTDPLPLPPPKKPERSSTVFRIPETDIVKTEDWIFDIAEGTSGPEELINEDLVHDYQSVTHSDVPGIFVNYGFVGSLKDTRDGDPSSFIYKINSTESNNVESAIERDIRDAYGSHMLKEASESDTYSETGVQPDEDVGDLLNNETPTSIVQDENKDVQHPKMQTSEEDAGKQLNIHDESPSFAAGDFQRGAYLSNKDLVEDSVKPRRVSRIQVYYEFCEMYYYQFGKILPRRWVLLAYIVCIGAIIAATVVCCIYGERYGYKRTHNWCFSLLICLIENMIVFQFIKTLAVVIIETCLITSKVLGQLYFSTLQ
ncbi:unnamed protein product [Orchesella dallaii]|uniref:Uncharacterized protein n=1 Tax=Orchesella dallaii TaxID=48710 RepID=A0ABP1QX08_9HEXA